MTREEERVMKDLVDRAGADRMILCPSKDEYFRTVDRAMYSVGVDRQGVGRVVMVSGRKYIIDVWVLPSGTTINAGYPAPAPVE